MRKLLYLLGFLVLLLGVGVAVLLWALQDANRFKPELEALVQESTGMPIKFNGDLSWQVWPPVVLAGEDIAFADEDTDYQIGSVGVRADVMALLRGGGLVVQELRASNVVLTDKRFGDITRLASVQVDNFEPGKPSALSVRGELVTPEGEQSQVALDGQLTYFPDDGRLTLSNANFDYDTYSGTCDAKVSNLDREPALSYKAGKDDLLPLDSFRAYDWVADCKVPSIQTEDLTINDVAIHSENTNSRSKTTITVPALLGGKLNADVAIDTRQRTPKWNIKTAADGLQAQEVAKLLSPKLSWIAPLLADGEYQARGNTPDALLASMKGAMEFNGGNGTIDITQIKSMILGLAQLAGEGERVQNWQDQLAYEQFDGDWKVDGNTHDLSFTLDNLLITAVGDFDPTSGSLDMRGALQINEHPTLKTLDINPELYGLAIPIRCRGTAEEPSCGLDRENAQKALTQLAANKAGAKVSEELDKALEDNVPEEYRETAREALKGLGGLFKKKD